MDDDSIDELASLVVGFLQQSLKEFPRGFTLRDFERLFPDRSDEPADWYKRYKKSTTLGALELIKEHVMVNYDTHRGCNYIQLNPKSSKVDRHLVDLIINQKESTKKKRGPIRSSQSDRARASFALNRQYSNYSQAPHHPSRLNQSHFHRTQETRPPPPAPIPTRHTIYEETAARAAPGDPRASRNFVPPQVKPPKQPSATHFPPRTLSSERPTSAPSRSSAPSPTSKPRESQEDSSLVQRKQYVRQKILSMLTRKYSEIKLLHLAHLYESEYDEQLDPSSLGHKNLSSLFNDPVLKEQIDMGFKMPFHFIFAKAHITGKENVAQNGLSVDEDRSSEIRNSAELFGHSMIKTSTRHKLEAIDPFNVKTMLKSLQPIRDIREPDLKNKKVEDAVKYKTLRIILRSQEHQMRLDDWERKFEQESRLKIRIRDYGFKTLLEFFKHLALEMPIKIRLDRNDDWYAEVELHRLSSWLHEQMALGHYRVMWVMDSNYELAALPTDTYNFVGLRDLDTTKEYHPVMILSVSEQNLMWIQMRTPQKIEQHLCIEASLTCYEDYKKQGLFKVQDYFIQPGFPCAVFEESQQRWCRALLLRTPDLPIGKSDEVIALLVDYGLVKKYPVSRLLCLMKQHLKLPVGPIFSRLYGIARDDVKKVHHARIILAEYTSPPVTLACKFMSPCESNEPSYLPNEIQEITLLDTRHGVDCNLADGINGQTD